MEKVRITSWGSGKVTFSGLEPEEIHKLQSVVAGIDWVKINKKGRVIARSTRKPLPKPTEDESMGQFWRRHQPVQTHLELDDFEKLEPYSSPNIIIQHLCGYHYTPESYANYAETLELWGFQCLRSQRGSCGRFWEMWMLPGAWAAQGELKEVVSRFKIAEQKAQTAEMVKLIAKRVRFGTLDVSVQKLAMVAAD